MWQEFRDKLLKQGTSSVCADGAEFTDAHHFTFFFGDLNYRLTDQSWTCFPTGKGIDKPWEKDEIPKEEYSNNMTNFIRVLDDEGNDTSTETEKLERWRSLYAHDQLKREMRAGKTLSGFREMEPAFAPTFKFEMVKDGSGMDRRVVPPTYKAQRQPAYCDRVLWKALPSVKTLIRQDSFEVPAQLETSDHDPVAANFTVFVPLKPQKLQESVEAEADTQSSKKWRVLKHKKWKSFEITSADEKKLNEEYKSWLHLHSMQRGAQDETDAIPLSLWRQPSDMLQSVLSSTLSCCKNSSSLHLKDPNEVEIRRQIELEGSNLIVELGNCGSSAFGDFEATAWPKSRAHGHVRKLPGAAVAAAGAAARFVPGVSGKELKIRPENPSLIMSLEQLSIEEGSGLQVLRAVSQKYSGRPLPGWDVLSKEFGQLTIDATSAQKVQKYNVEIASPDLHQDDVGDRPKHGTGSSSGCLKWERGSPEEQNVRGLVPEWKKPADGTVFSGKNSWPEIRTPYHNMAVLSHEFVDAETHHNHAFHHTVLVCVWGGERGNKEDEEYLGCAPVSLDGLDWEFRKHATPQWKAVKRFSGVSVEKHGMRRDGLSVSGAIEVSLVYGRETEQLRHKGNSFTETWAHVISCLLMMVLSGVVSAIFNTLTMLSASDELYAIWWPLTNMLTIPALLLAGFTCDMISFIHTHGDDDENPEDSTTQWCGIPTLQHTCQFGWFVGMGMWFWIQVALRVDSSSSWVITMCSWLSVLCLATQQGLCILTSTMMLQDLLGTAARRGVSKWQAFAFAYVFFYLSRAFTIKTIDLFAAGSCNEGLDVVDSGAYHIMLVECNGMTHGVSWGIAVCCLLGWCCVRIQDHTSQWRIAELTKLANIHSDEKQHRNRKQQQQEGGTSLAMNKKHQLARGLSPETNEFGGTDLLRTMKLDKPNKHGQVAGYTKRQFVDDEHVSWDALFPRYSPIDYTAIKDRGSPDDRDASKVEGLDKRFSFEGELKTSKRSETNESGGRPWNPRGRTGIRGRGEYYQWGPNHCVDIIVTRAQTDNDGVDVQGGVEVAYIDFRDSNRHAILGMVLTEKHSGRLEAAKECLLKKGFGVDPRSADEDEQKRAKDVDSFIEDLWKNAQEHDVVYQGYVDDPRNTDNAWSETCAYHIHLDAEFVERAHDLKFKAKYDLLPSLSEGKTQDAWRHHWYFWTHAELCIACAPRARELSEQHRLEQAEDAEARRGWMAAVTGRPTDSKPSTIKHGWGPVHALGPWMHCLLVHSFVSGYIHSIPKSWCAYQLTPNDACGRDHCANVEAFQSGGAMVGLILAATATYTTIKGTQQPPGWGKSGALGVQRWTSTLVFYSPMVIVVLMTLIAFDDTMPVCDSETESCTSTLYIPLNQSAATLSATMDAFNKFDCGKNVTGRVT